MSLLIVGTGAPVTCATGCAKGNDDGAERRPATGLAHPPPIQRLASPNKRSPETPRPGTDLRDLFAAADARTFTDALRVGLLMAEPATRAEATWALARLHAPERAADLRSALRDPAPSVRQAASFGLAALEADAPAGTESALLGALATEADASTRAALLSDLGRIATDTAQPALQAALTATTSLERTAACHGLGAIGLRGRAVDASLLRLVAATASADPDSGARLACCYALSRLPAPADTDADTAAVVVDALARAARDPVSEVRLMAARAVVKYPSTPTAILMAFCADADWRVAAQGFRSLGRRSGVGSDGAYAVALRAALDRLAPAPALGPPPSTGRVASHLAAPTAHVLLVALEEAAGVATGVNVAPVAEEALRRLSIPEATATRADGLAQCRAAKLVDLAYGWPQRVLRCGLGQVSEVERSIASAEVLQATTGDPAARAGFLLRLYEGGAVQVREAVLTAAATLDQPITSRLLLRGLRDPDLGVVTSALEAVSAQPARLLAVADAPSPARPVAVPAVPAPPAEQPAPSTRLSSDARSALLAAYATLAATDELEGLQAWLDAVAAVRDPALASTVRLLAVNANVAVRRKAQETLDRLNLPASAAPPAALSNALRPSEFPTPGERLSAVLTLPHGEVEIALLPDEAPATVARFVALAERHFYDGLRFHRVVPAFVVQTGDPRADGYGGPGYAQRCEDNGVAYERGTVGMALAGRDTGGSQFFITQASEPHLDGRYTAFGRVVRGMDLIDEVLVNDALTSIRIVHTAGITGDTAR